MELFNPQKYTRFHADPGSEELARRAIAFFEQKGLAKIKADDQAAVWYEDFLNFINKEHIFAHFLTPAKYSGLGGRLAMTIRRNRRSFTPK